MGEYGGGMIYIFWLLRILTDYFWVSFVSKGLTLKKILKFSYDNASLLFLTDFDYYLHLSDICFFMNVNILIQL